eukprot:TRINITY_DN12427_c0_g1_i1.p1 TRINITY_DN12427_c0_g1~~TRINITY_DN12427_c0_g1_i1.p1  ORF type:complete len:345 (+),score=22.25 TRINITY_DN12427_c0_g1_i1:372-1406(+)
MAGTSADPLHPSRVGFVNGVPSSAPRVPVANATTETPPALPVSVPTSTAPTCPPTATASSRNATPPPPPVSVTHPQTAPSDDQGGRPTPTSSLRSATSPVRATAGGGTRTATQPPGYSVLPFVFTGIVILHENRALTRAWTTSGSGGSSPISATDALAEDAVADEFYLSMLGGTRACQCRPPQAFQLDDNDKAIFRLPVQAWRHWLRWSKPGTRSKRGGDGLSGDNKSVLWLACQPISAFFKNGGADRYQRVVCWVEEKFLETLRVVCAARGSPLTFGGLLPSHFRHPDKATKAASIWFACLTRVYKACETQIDARVPAAMDRFAFPTCPQPHVSSETGGASAV